MELFNYKKTLQNLIRPEMKEQEALVLSYPKLKERIEKRPEDGLKAIEIIKEIRAEYSVTFLKSFEKFLDATLPQVYDGINFNDQGQNLAELSKNHHVVVVPNHQSHADYVAINYVFFKKYQAPLYVAGGINLNIFPIGSLFRRSGCFFIRRSFASDILYKLTLEAYLYALLYERHPIEFFFEGGRSRTGKLLPPRYGLYQMLIEAHDYLPQEHKYPLMFVPVSIVHESLPEQKSLAREVEGGTKVKENSWQIFSLIKIFSYQFGNVHINLGQPIISPHLTDDHRKSLKDFTQKTALRCFYEVGKNMRVTPTSLLSMILLDNASGALKWDEILEKARLIVAFCERFKIPITDSLQMNQLEKSMTRTIDILIGNKKIEVIGNSNTEHVFYSIKKECRKEILYFKNTIIHHFLSAWIVHLAWVNMFSGHITSVDDLKRYFIKQRKSLMYEFYLPTVKEFLSQALDIVGDAIGREVKSLDDCIKLNHKELYAILAKVSPLAQSLTYLQEAYFICGKTLWELNECGFRLDDFYKKAKEVHAREILLRRPVRYMESYSIPILKSSLQYFIHCKVVSVEIGAHQVCDRQLLTNTITMFEANLMSLRTLNLLA